MKPNFIQSTLEAVSERVTEFAKALSGLITINVIAVTRNNVDMDIGEDWSSEPSAPQARSTLLHQSDAKVVSILSVYVGKI